MLNLYQPRWKYRTPAKVTNHELEDLFHFHDGKWRSPERVHKFKEIARRNNSQSVGDEIDEHNRRLQGRIAEDIAVDVLLGK